MTNTITRTTTIAHPAGRLAGLGRARRADAAGAARLRRQHGAQLRPAADRPRPPAHGHPAALDHRRVPAGARQPAGDDGHPRRPVRPPPDAADRSDRLRPRLRPRRLRAERGVAHRRARGDGRLRRDAHAVDAVPPAHDLHQPRPAAHGDRRLGGRLLRRCGARPGRRRHPARALRMGVGVPAGRPRPGAAADPRSDPRTGEPRPESRPVRPAERRAVAGDDGADRLRDQGVRGARRRERAPARARRRRGSSSACSSCAARTASRPRCST